VFDRRERRGGQWSRRITAGFCAVGMATQVACHTYLPPQDVVPAAGHEIAVELNDRGRVLVGGQLGESVQVVQGRLIGSTDSTVTLSVNRTVLLRGSSAVWAGEQATIPREGVRGIRLRQFSKGRTVLLSIGIAVGLAVIGGVISLAGGGIGKSDGGSGPPNES